MEEEAQIIKLQKEKEAEEAKRNIKKTFINTNSLPVSTKAKKSNTVIKPTTKK
jgi:hypothetical protein